MTAALAHGRNLIFIQPMRLSDKLREDDRKMDFQDGTSLD